MVWNIALFCTETVIYERLQLQIWRHCALAAMNIYFYISGIHGRPTSATFFAIVRGNNANKLVDNREIIAVLGTV